MADNDESHEAELKLIGEKLEPLDEFPISVGLLSDRAAQIACYRLRRSAFNERSVHPADVEGTLARGWEVARRGKRTVRIRQPKPHHQVLEDRAWSLLYKMGYAELSSHAFAIGFRRDTGANGSKQIDGFACDAETAIIVECKSRTERGRRSLQKDLGETAAL